MTLIIFTDAVLTARSVAEKQGEKVDANHELIGLGAANIASGLLQGFPAAASQSRTAVNNLAGGKTQLVGIVAAAFLVAFLLWFTQLLENLPQVVLGVIIIAAAINLIEVKPLLKVYRLRHVEFYLALITFVGVLSIGLLGGILVAVGLALIVAIGRISRPHDAILGSVEGVDGYQDIEGYANSQTVPGLIAYRIDAPLFYANAEHFLKEVQDLIDAANPAVKWLLIDAEAIIDIDVTAAEALSELQQELECKGIILAVARANHRFSIYLNVLDCPSALGPRISFLRYVLLCKRIWLNRRNRSDGCVRWFFQIPQDVRLRNMLAFGTCDDTGRSSKGAERRL